LVYLLDRRFWGAGLGTEVAEACLRYGFGERGFKRIVAFARQENAASRRVLEKVGVRYEGESTAYGVSVVRYEITRDEFGRSRKLKRPEKEIPRQKKRPKKNRQD
jgi:ribosomal-protein-alanine N-acetyltransferase